ncbi:glycosyltransferase, partial [Pseudoalteromonas sp. S554]
DTDMGGHWHPCAENIIPPFSAHHEHSNPVPIINKVWLYLPFENLASIIDYRMAFPEKESYCYNPYSQNRCMRNIDLLSPSRGDSLNDLSNTR